MWWSLESPHGRAGDAAERPPSALRRRRALHHRSGPLRVRPVRPAASRTSICRSPAIYAPASEVAGDFYDFVGIDERCVGILVADVSGHGVPAALVASMLKVALAGHVDHAREPARLLHELNAFFCGKLERQFITATYTVIDTANGTATVGSAGHPSPLLVRRDRSIEELAADGALMGRFADARFSERSTPMRDGDSLALYTDGIPEALNAAGEMWGDARFHDSLASGMSAREILQAVKSWSTTLRDDVTLVVAKRV